MAGGRSFLTRPLGAASRAVVEALERKAAEKAAKQGDEVFDPYAIPGRKTPEPPSSLILPGDERFQIPNRTGIFDYDYKMPMRDSGVQRYIPKKGTTQRAQDVLSNRNVFDQMVEGTQRGMEMSPDDWYEVGPLFKSFIDEFGPDEGQKRFDVFMTAVAGTSPRSKVGENVRNASYYYGQAMPYRPPGSNLPPEGFVEDLPAKPEEGYGHLAQNLHRGNAVKTLYPDSPGFSERKNPKPLSFMWNFRGDPNLVTVDTHAFRAPNMLAGDPRFLERGYEAKLGEPRRNIQDEFFQGQHNMEDLQNWGAAWQSKPRENEYAAYEDYYKRIANELGITPRHAQGSAWIGHGGMTGLESAPKPFMDFVEERILKTARERGMDPADVWREAIRGQRPLTMEERLLEGLPGASMVG